MLARSTIVAQAPSLHVTATRGLLPFAAEATLAIEAIANVTHARTKRIG
ncbi:MAG: hypothetical protein IAG13_22925 [Deltaproteobacteria bacterium]|nr:hypothetical protein [Nannocystaceae bacterium]